MGLVLHVIDIAETAVNDGAGIVDGLRIIALLRSHRVDDSQCVLIQNDGFIVLLASIMHLCKMTYHILTYIQSVQLITQHQCLAAVVFSLFTVVR